MKPPEGRRAPAKKRIITHRLRMFRHGKHLIVNSIEQGYYKIGRGHEDAS